MKKSLITLLVLGVFFFGSALCWHKVAAMTQHHDDSDYARYTTKEITGIVPFSAIELKGFANVEFVQGDRIKVSAYGSDATILDVLSVYNRGNALVVETKNNSRIRRHGKIKVVVSGPNLTSISVLGSGDVNVRGALKAPSLSLKVTGSGDIDMDRVTSGSVNVNVTGSGGIEFDWLECTAVSAAVSGSGDVDLKGTCNSATYKLSGSGDIDADEMRAETVVASVSGSGEIDCHASLSLAASVSGSGDIEYRGRPDKIAITGKRNSVRPKR